MLGEQGSTRPSHPFGVGADLKAPPLLPVPTLVAIEILMSKYVFGMQFLLLLWIILAPWITIWRIQGHPGAAKRSPLGAGINLRGFLMDFGVPGGFHF